MKSENKDLIRLPLERSESLQEDIFADSEQMLGSVPFILKIMARRPEFMIFPSLKDSLRLAPEKF